MAELWKDDPVDFFWLIVLCIAGVAFWIVASYIHKEREERKLSRMTPQEREEYFRDTSL